MEKEIKEHNELIATRVPPGDRWELVADPKKQVHPTLTETLEAYLNKTSLSNFNSNNSILKLNYKLYKTEDN